MYTKVAWARVVGFVEVSVYPTEALLKGFDETWSARNVLGRWDKMKIKGNWKRQRM